MKICIPDATKAVLERLEAAGWAAFVVGGCVRDSLLGRTPGDWDITTAAWPEQVHQALAGLPVLDTGLKHGTVTALVGESRLEITTFRTEGPYSDHRRPDSVAFAQRVEDDLARRDFTVNAMAYSPKTGLIDPFGGLIDLQNGLLQAVGDPLLRFDEDALRILRGLRFAARLGFSIEERTAQAMLARRQLLSTLAGERVREELTALLCAPGAVEVLRQYRAIFAVVLPELAPMFDFDQHNKHHSYDVWEHTLHALEHIPPRPDLRLVMLLHDCGKPERFTVDFRGDGHFYGHAYAGARRAQTALERLRCSRELTGRVTRLIALHDHDLLNSRVSLLRWLRKLGPEELALLLQVKIADNLGQHPRYLRVETFRQTQTALEGLLAEQPCYDLSRLAVKGSDLVQRGLSGPAVGAALEGLLEAVISGRTLNEREALLALAERGTEGAAPPNPALPLNNQK